MPKEKVQVEGHNVTIHYEVAIDTFRLARVYLSRPVTIGGVTIVKAEGEETGDDVSLKDAVSNLIGDIMEQAGMV